MRPAPARSKPRGPEEDPRFEADLDPQEVALATGAYPLTSTEGEIAGQRGAGSLDDVGPPKGPAEELEEETAEAGAKRGIRP